MEDPLERLGMLGFTDLRRPSTVVKVAKDPVAGRRIENLGSLNDAQPTKPGPHAYPTYY